MKSITETGNIDFNGHMVRISKGIIVSVVLTLILLFAFSMVLTYSNIGESSITPVIIIISGISILTGSSISTLKLTKNGMVNGGGIGLLYMIILYVISSLASGSFMLNTTSMIVVISGIMAGALGGIIGINLK